MADVTNGTGVEDLRAYLGGYDNSGASCFQALMKALSGDIVLKCTPATATPAPTEAAWEQTVLVSLETADGERHSWFNGKLALAIADTSTAGTASIYPTETAPYMTDGAYTVKIKGDAAAWLAGTKQVETIQVTAGASSAGDLTVTVTAAGIDADNSVAVTVPVTTDDNTAPEVAAKIVAGLAANTTVAAFFTVAQGTDSDTDKVIITSKAPAANDTTMQIAVSAASTGVTVGSSANTTAGVAPETVTLTVNVADQDPGGGTTDYSILGYSVTATTCVLTFTA
jgi:hypothetical protein